MTHILGKVKKKFENKFTKKRNEQRPNKFTKQAQDKREKISKIKQEEYQEKSKNYYDQLGLRVLLGMVTQGEVLRLSS